MRRLNLTNLPKIGVYSLLVGLTIVSVLTTFGLVRSDRLPRWMGGSAVSQANTSSSLSGGPSNNVKVQNQCSDTHVVGRAKTEYNDIPGQTIKPSNLAEATSTGQGCQTIAIAAQVNTYQIGATNVSPANAAVAVNAQCTNCRTFAIACQYTIPVDDENNPPAAIKQGFSELTRLLNDAIDNASSAQDAAAKGLAACQALKEFAQYLMVTQDVKDDSGQPTLTPTAPAATATQPTQPTPPATTVPTSAPTLGPTPAATSEPTVVATTAPTAAPTTEPTAAATTAPTSPASTPVPTP